MRQINVHLLPSLVAADDLQCANCVVIDVLRATTTIVEALAAGASEVLPCLEIDDAKSRAKSLEPGSFLLGGERQGQRIAGFDLGNSPLEYSLQRVAGKKIVFTTTNGTRAMLHCRQAYAVLLASFTNLSAVCRVLGRESEVDVLCAGTDGKISREDVLLAGAIADRLVDDEVHTALNDEARLARDAWRYGVADNSSSLAMALMKSRGGQNLLELGMAADIEHASQIDLHTIVPFFANGRITPRDAID